MSRNFEFRLEPDALGHTLYLTVTGHRVVAAVHSPLSHVFTCARFNLLYRAPEDRAAHPSRPIHCGYQRRAPGPRPTQTTHAPLAREATGA